MNTIIMFAVVTVALYAMMTLVEKKGKRSEKEVECCVDEEYPTVSADDNERELSKIDKIYLESLNNINKTECESDKRINDMYKKSLERINSIYNKSN